MVAVGVGVAVGVLVGVDVGVLVGVDVGVLVGVDVGVLVGVDVGVAVGVAVGVLVGEEVEVGPVEYVVAPAATETKMDWTYLTVPVPPMPLQQPTAHSSVPGLDALSPLPAVFSNAPTLPSSVPLNAAVMPTTVGEIRLTSVPPLVNSASWADPWKPLGHPSVVDQVGAGDRVRAPLDGFRARLPGSDPTPAARANPAVSSPAPAIIPSAPMSKTARRIPVTVLHLAFAPRREPRRSLVTGMGVDATASSANSGSTGGEKLENDLSADFQLCSSPRTGVE